MKKKDASKIKDKIGNKWNEANNKAMHIKNMFRELKQFNPKVRLHACISEIGQHASTFMVWAKARIRNVRTPTTADPNAALPLKRKDQ